MMSFICDNLFSRSSLIIFRFSMPMCFLLSVVLSLFIGGGEGGGGSFGATSFRYSKPNVKVTRGSFANHHPFLYTRFSNSYPTAFVGFPPAIPFISKVPFVKLPGNQPLPSQTSGWPSDTTPINVGGVKVVVETVGHPSKNRTSISTSKECCPTCGPFFRTGQWYTRDYFPSSRVPPISIWPQSTSQYKPLRITTQERGNPNSGNYVMYFRNEDGPISPFHDVPLFANEGNKIFNMVVEVPRWTNAKMEIATKDRLNPIKQDVKKGKLRYVANVFPHHGYIWNYGALPQTWEDPNHSDEATGCQGDNDPIDVCEIGYRVAKRGEVIQVKILGTLALIDEGETDWKLIAIDVNDPLAPQLSDISDVEKHMPGFLKATVEWFKIYKIPDGKPENQFAFDGMAKDREFAHKIIMETHEAWQNLVDGTADAGGLDNTCSLIPNAANKISGEEAEGVVNSAAEPGPAVPLDPKVDLWHYVTLK